MEVPCNKPLRSVVCWSWPSARFLHAPAIDTIEDQRHTATTIKRRPAIERGIAEVPSRISTPTDGGRIRTAVPPRAGDRYGLVSLMVLMSVLAETIGPRSHCRPWREADRRVDRADSNSCPTHRESLRLRQRGSARYARLFVILNPAGATANTADRPAQRRSPAHPCAVHRYVDTPRFSGETKWFSSITQLQPQIRPSQEGGHAVCQRDRYRVDPESVDGPAGQTDGGRH